jgi:hypothetical protein
MFASFLSIEEQELDVVEREFHFLITLRHVFFHFAAQINALAKTFGTKDFLEHYFFEM